MKAETGICGPRSLLTAHRLHENLNNISLGLQGLAGFLCALYRIPRAVARFMVLRQS